MAAFGRKGSQTLVWRYAWFESETAEVGRIVTCCLSGLRLWKASQTLQKAFCRRMAGFCTLRIQNVPSGLAGWSLGAPSSDERVWARVAS